MERHLSFACMRAKTGEDPEENRVSVSLVFQSVCDTCTWLYSLSDWDLGGTVVFFFFLLHWSIATCCVSVAFVPTEHVKCPERIQAVSCSDDTVTLLSERGTLFCVDPAHTPFSPRYAKQEGFFVWCEFGYLLFGSSSVRSALGLWHKCLCAASCCFRTPEVLCKTPVQQVACGSQHSVALTKGTVEHSRLHLNARFCQLLSQSWMPLGRGIRLKHWKC